MVCESVASVHTCLLWVVVLDDIITICSQRQGKSEQVSNKQAAMSTIPKYIYIPTQAVYDDDDMSAVFQGVSVVAERYDEEV
jgi:hypothetical protein